MSGDQSLYGTLGRSCLLFLRFGEEFLLVSFFLPLLSEIALFLEFFQQCVCCWIGDISCFCQFPDAISFGSFFAHQFESFSLPSRKRSFPLSYVFGHNCNLVRCWFCRRYRTPRTGKKTRGASGHCSLRRRRGHQAIIMILPVSYVYLLNFLYHYCCI